MDVAADVWGSVADWVSALANAAIAWGAFRVAAQWKDQQAWRREEQVARQKATALQFLESFIETPGARNAALMLSTRSREVPLWDNSEPAERYETVSWTEVDHAFTWSEGVEYPLDRKSVAIRDSFNDFFGRLGRLEGQIDAGLIDKSDSDFIMDHWAWVFGEGRSNEPHMRQIKEYIVRSNLDRVIKLFERYAVSVKGAM